MAVAFFRVITFLMALFTMAFFTLFERKLLALAQLRKGPRKVGLVGLPQPFADAMKLFFKQQVTPRKANRFGFLAAPSLGLGLSLSLWLINPHRHTLIIVPFGAVFFLMISRLAVYVVLMAGWCSNSKYALLGTMRAIAQTISYEVRMALFLLAGLVLLMRYNFNTPLLDRMSWSLFLVPALFVC